MKLYLFFYKYVIQIQYLTNNILQDQYIQYTKSKYNRIQYNGKIITFNILLTKRIADNY